MPEPGSVVVVGGTSGLGLEVARHYANQGREVVLSGRDRLGHLVLAAIERDENRVHAFDLEGATRLATLKLVGYAEVVHQLASRMDGDGSVVLFGGRAKDRPYPGSTMVSTVNGGVTRLVQSPAVALGPLRCNALPPGILGD